MSDQTGLVWLSLGRRTGKLAFCRATQDGDDERCLHLDHLSTPAEADLIRDALRIKRKRHYTMRVTLAG